MTDMEGIKEYKNQITLGNGDESLEKVKDKTNQSLESLRQEVELTTAEKEAIKKLPDYTPDATAEEKKAREMYFTRMKNSLTEEIDKQKNQTSDHISSLEEAIQSMQQKTKKTNEKGEIIFTDQTITCNSLFEKLITAYIGSKCTTQEDPVECSRIDIDIRMKYDTENTKASGWLIALWDDYITLDGSYTGYQDRIAEKDLLATDTRPGSHNISKERKIESTYTEFDNHKENKKENLETRIATDIATIATPMSLEEWESDYSNQYDKKKVNEVLSLVRSWMGTPYLLGGRSPGRGIDCSGMIIVALQRLGLKDIGGASGPMFNKTKDLTINKQGYRNNNDLIKDENKIIPGSLVFWQATVKPNKYNTHGNMIHHVAIVSNPPFINGKLNIIESRGGTGVIENTINLDRIADKSNHQSTIHIHNNPPLQA